MKRVPSDLNLVRVTGLGVEFPRQREFSKSWDQLSGDHQKYLVRDGYRLERCPGEHGFWSGCDRCAPYHGAVAVRSGK